MSISDVMAAYDEIRRRNKIEEDRRRRQVYREIPELETLHRQLTALQLERLKQAISGEPTDGEEILALREKARRMMLQAGFDAHYLDPLFSCPVCQDTGIREDARRCDCFKKRVLEDKLDEAKLTDSCVSFEQFDLSVFDDTPMENGRSQRDFMERYRQIAQDYADHLEESPLILLLSGATGLGKTFLSKCIMRRVMERGYTAAYYTAYRLFSLFHRDRLGEDIDLDPVFEVPLLIIDDIGTEPMTKNVTIEYFFDLINERNGAKLHTVIATNLGFYELNERYGERIHSRLMDKRVSEKILFKGKDIRY